MMSGAAPGGSNLVVATLGRALGSLWDFFWPLFAPLGLLLLLAFVAFVIRKVTNVG